MRSELLNQVKDLKVKLRDFNYEISLLKADGHTSNLEERERYFNPSYVESFNAFLNEYRSFIEAKELEHDEVERDYSLLNDEVVESLNEDDLKIYVEYLKKVYESKVGSFEDTESNLVNEDPKKSFLDEYSENGLLGDEVK